jgi:hypothetical protein
MAYSKTLRLILRHHDPLGYIYIYIYIRALITSWLLLLPSRRHGGNAAASAAAAAVALRLGVAGLFFRLAGKSIKINNIETASFLRFCNFTSLHFIEFTSYSRC